MKTNLRFFLFSALAFALLSFPLSAQDEDEVTSDSTGLPGDHFSLEGALELFKKAESIEDFEKLLNTEDNDVNNLDLNEDGKIDYIRVVDRMDGDVHAFVLQAPVSEKESQDVAVIELEKTGNESAVLQIIGDEDLYGEQTIAEPFEEEEVEQGGKNGPAAGSPTVAIVVNVWGWPSVRFVYRPAYVAYVSPWRWGLYPGWWRPWRPRPWGVFHVRVAPYRVHYHVVSTHRVVRAHRVYTPHRSHSTVVHTRTVTKVNARGGTKTTSKTTVRGRNGNVKAQKTTTTRTGKHGNVSTKKSTTKVRRKRG
ncbi:MAG: hypothetical protein IPJ82_08735 [Lewinellaceae bacterium]|nr:hypothetical protein [Lewinellaceae bacterium]